MQLILNLHSFLRWSWFLHSLVETMLVEKTAAQAAVLSITASAACNCKGGAAAAVAAAKLS